MLEFINVRDDVHNLPPHMMVNTPSQRPRETVKIEVQEQMLVDHVFKKLTREGLLGRNQITSFTSLRTSSGLLN